MRSIENLIYIEKVRGIKEKVMGTEKLTVKLRVKLAVMAKVPLGIEYQPGIEDHLRSADYLIKRAMSDLGSMDDFLHHVLFTDSLWQQKVL